jgi:signal transduction histidine kinase
MAKKKTTAEKPNLLSNMKIDMRVGLSFLVILIIFIATSVFNLNIFTQSETSFSHYSKVNSDAMAIFDIDRQVSELQRITLIYSNTGNAAVIRRAQKTHQTLIDNLYAIQATITHEESLSLLDVMIKELVGYGENITALAESREQRDRLIDQSMLSLANEASEIVEELKKTAQDKGDSSLVKKIYFISEQLLTAQVNAVSFLGNRQYSLQTKTKNALQQAKQKTMAISQSETTSAELKALTLALTENISAYENLFHRTIQATRGYLSLINVVMAGQANEFTIQSRNLKNSTLTTVEQLTQLTKERLASAQKTTYVVTAVAIAIGFALAFFTGRSLSRPIREIAETFEQLVSGKHNTTIPGLNRGDEIGQLATAANVFKTMNEHTEKILKESQALATQLQQRENQLEKQAAKLQKSNDELDEFAYIASHDLKSPLRAIDNLAMWIQEDCDAILPEESREHLDKMQQRIKRMENLLSDLLSYSRVGRVEVTVEKVQTTQLIQNITEFINKPDNTIINISDDLPDITTQVSPLEQVFLNLFTNAIKYSDKDQIIINVSSQLHNDGFVEFSVSDNGPGIDSQFHERIFQMFQTLQSRDTIESTGMGLAIIKKVIEGQGGEISVESALGDGAIFKFSWPLNKTSNPEVLS